jgi:hypothetical protein
MHMETEERPTAQLRTHRAEKTERRAVRLYSPDPAVLTNLWTADVTWDKEGFVKPFVYRGRLWRFSHEEVPIGRDTSEIKLLVFEDAGAAPEAEA